MAFEAFKKILDPNIDDEQDMIEEEGEEDDYDTDGIPHTKPKFVLKKPVDRTELAEIAQDLMHDKVVILNLDNINKSEIRRYLDFLQGTIFALRGEIKKLSDDTYMFIPGKVDINGDILEDVEKLL